MSSVLAGEFEIKVKLDGGAYGNKTMRPPFGGPIAKVE